MLAMILSEDQNRLIFRGSCLDADLRHVVRVLGALKCTSPELTLDVSRVSGMSWSVAEAILRTCDKMEAGGVQVLLRTRPGSEVERMLNAVRDNHRQARLIRLVGQRI